MTEKARTSCHFQIDCLERVLPVHNVHDSCQRDAPVGNSAHCADSLGPLLRFEEVLLNPASFISDAAQRKCRRSRTLPAPAADSAPAATHRAKRLARKAELANAHLWIPFALSLLQDAARQPDCQRFALSTPRHTHTEGPIGVRTHPRERTVRTLRRAARVALRSTIHTAS